MSVRDFTKTNIRLKKVHQRLCKDIIPKSWTAQKRRLFKLNERRENLSKAIDDTFKIMYQRGYKPNEAESDKWRESFDAINDFDKRRESVINSINRLESKYQLDSDAVIIEHRRHNTGRLSQSF